MDPDFPLDPKVPVRHWTDLSESDKQRYRDLKIFFRQQQKEHLKEHMTTPFASEIISILQYVDQDTPGRDDRCIVAGIAFAGPFICVNTQQLKNLVCRCKSSINSGFQQIGYDAIRNKTKAREAILAIIPTLRLEPVCIRQWTVRCAGRASFACFVSRWIPEALPEILQEDFYEEKRATRPTVSNELLQQMFRFKPAPLEVRQVEDGGFDEEDEEEPPNKKSMTLGDEFQSSLSMDFLAGYEDPFSLDFDFQWISMPSNNSQSSGVFPRSQSTCLNKTVDWLGW